MSMKRSLPLKTLWIRFSRVANVVGALSIAGFVLFALGEVLGVWDDSLTKGDDTVVEKSTGAVERSVSSPPADVASLNRRKITPLPPPPVRAAAPSAHHESAHTENNTANRTYAPGGISGLRPGAAIALIIDDLGLNASATRKIAELDGPLTMAFLPYADGLSHQTALARAAGHELLVHMPMQPKSLDTDPGPMALLSGMDDQAFLSRLNWNLARFEGFVGINNHMGSRLTEDRHAMGLVMAGLKERGLIFLDSRTTADSVAEPMARAQGVPHLSRDVFLDNDQTVPAILEQLGELERIAKRTGLAVGIGHPYPQTIEALTLWLPQAKRRGLVLIPMSRAVERPGQVSLKSASTAP